MKRILLVAGIALLSSALEAQAVKDTDAVGIETSKPRATLDVGGDVRIQKVPQYQKGQTTADAEIYADCPCQLIVDKNGVVKRRPLKAIVKGFDSENLPEGYVKDRNFGDGEHDFIYKVITGNDGKKWLNNNLGADYANVHSPVFNPDQQATSRRDYHAYGSLFQWQRKADGHELITWSADTGTSVHGSTLTLASSWASAGTNKFIVTDSDDEWSWVKNGSAVASGANVQLWRAGGSNNPCPQGYHVPTKSEWVEYQNSIRGLTWDNVNMTEGDALRLSNPDARFTQSGYIGHASYGTYWTSTVKPGANQAWFYKNLRPIGENSDSAFYATSLSIRCLQD